MCSLTKSFLIPLALQVALYATSSSADLVINWASYPSSSVNCLNQAQASAKCPSKDVPSFNGCVCKNENGFLQTAATCLGSGDPGDAADVFNQLSTNCAGTNIPVNINLAQWNAWASPADSVTAHPSTSMVTQPSSSQTSVGIITGNSNISTITQPNPGSSAPANTLGASSSGGGPKLGIGAIAGIAVGCAVIIAITGLTAVLLLHRGRNQPTTVSPVVAAAAVPLSPLNSDVGTGSSSGTAQANPYKTDRPVLSTPPTVSSDLNRTGEDFDPPQREYAVPRPPPQQYMQMQQGYPEYPPGKQSLHDPQMYRYTEQQYLGAPYWAQVPYKAQPTQQYVAYPGPQYSELSSEPARR